MPNAEITNALTNLLHAFFLFAYFMLALQHRIKDATKNSTPQLFSTTIVLFFFTIFIMKLMAVYIHYAPETNLALDMWVFVALGFGFMTSLLTLSFAMNNNTRILMIFLSYILIGLFITRQQNFLYLAMFLILLNGYFAIKTKKMLRYGFLMMIFANVVWYSLRLWISHLLKLPEVPYAFRYDNDVYHLLLILGTFMIYKGFARGLWNYSVIDTRKNHRYDQN